MRQATKDPVQAKNGKCHCGAELPELALKSGDPFCSAKCAREWHGLPDSTTA